MQSAQFQLHAQIEERHWWFLGRRDILRAVVREVVPPLRRGGRGGCEGATAHEMSDTCASLRASSPRPLVVDIGCGTGANLAALADDYDCLGIDTSGDAIRLARKRFPNVRFVEGEAPGDLGPAAAQAKLFLLTDVMEHVPDDFELLSRLLAAASPGAYFLVTVPADMALWSAHDVSFGHYRRYTAKRFAQVWEGLPVETRLLSHFNSRLYPVVRAIRAWNRRREKTSGAAGTDFSLPSAPVNWALRWFFAGESRALLRQLQKGERKPAYRRGVSLIALLERQPGAVAVRHKPAGIEPDHAACPTVENEPAGVA
ncbi:MAG: class I SAM-dependent methyltransferase [Planctomycetia bacterium]|nr:class I SAM-dependent methyltransferase [Planctomycetia bacterium]